MPARISEHGGRLDRHPVLTFSRGRRLKFYFNAKPMYGHEGETIAAALVANGIKVFRHTDKLERTRGFFCAVGKCSSCLMVVDGHPNTMVCMEPLREGCRVDQQKGRGRLP